MPGPDQPPEAMQERDDPSRPGAVARKPSAPGAGAAPPDRADEWAAEAEACEREAGARGPGREAARLLHQVGRLCEERLARPDDALAAYRAAIGADPTHLPSLQAARRLAASEGDTVLEAELLEAEARATPDARRAASLEHARALLLGGPLGRPAQARAALAEAAARDPANPAIAVDHGRLAAAAGHMDDLLLAWRRAADALGDGPAAAGLLAAAASLAEERMGRLDEAADLALAAFRRCPADASVRSLARRHAERLGRLEELAGVLAAEGREAVRPRDGALAFLQLGRLLERLGRPEEAREALAAARERAPSDTVALAELARIAEAREEWSELAALLAQLAAAHRADPTAADAESAAAAVRLAEVQDQRLGRPDEAVQSLRAALELDPGDRAALSALGRHHARREDWPALLETFLAERDAAGDVRERAQRCFKAAELLEERLGRPEDAAAMHQEALALDAGLLASTRALERLLEKLGRFADLCELLERDLAETADPAQQEALLFRIARLREDRLDDAEGAAACYRRVLDLEPQHLLALRSLAVALERAGRREEHAEVLERAAAVSAPREAVALLTRAGEVREEAGDEAQAAADWEQVLAIDPVHLPALRALGRLCARAGRWEELVDMCRTEATALPTSEAAAALLVRVGEILETKLGRPEDAVAAFREALALAPAQPGALRALARLHRARGEAGPLAEVLRADAATRRLPAERAALLHEAALLCEERLGDAAAAAEACAEALRADPSHAPAHRTLQRLCAAQGRWEDLAAACEAEAAAAPGAERAAALLRLAWIRAERLGDAAGAERACREVLAATPGHAGALALLDRLGASAPGSRALLAAGAPPSAAHDLWLAAALDARLAGTAPALEWSRALELQPDDPLAGPAAEQEARQRGALATVAAIWEAREAAAAGADRADCALAAADAWDEAGEGARAGAAVARAAALDPDSLPVHRAMQRLRARAGDWGGVRDALHAEADAARDPAVAAASLSRAADIALERLGDREGAAEDLRAAMGRDPRALAPANRLEALLQGSLGDADLCALREVRARAAPPDQAAENWLAAARFASDRLQDPGRALRSLDGALAARPGWGPALLQRGRTLAALGRVVEAARDLSAALARGGDSAEQAPLHLELAALHGGPLGNPTRAMSHLNAVLAANPVHAGALGRLADVHLQARNWPGAADVLRRLVSTAGLAAEERAARLLQLAQVRADGFGDPAAAARACERALELVPGHPGAIDLLAGVRERAGDLAGAVAALERAAAAAPLPGRNAARRRAAQALAGPLGDPARAASLLRAAVADDPADRATREALAETLAAVDPPAAVDEHRRLLALDASSVDVWRALFRIFRQARTPDRAFVAAGVLRFLRAADPASDGAFLAENDSIAPRQPAQSLLAAEWVALRHPLDRGALSDLMALLCEALGPFAGKEPPPGAPAPGGHPVRRLLEDLCRVLGADAFTLVEEEGAGLSVDATPPDRVRVGVDFARRHGISEQRFLLGRVAARLRSRNALVDHLGPGRLGEFLAAAVRQVDPGWSGTGDPGDGLVRQVGRAIPRRLRRQIEEILPRLGQEKVDVAGWCAAAAASADRAGLLLAADVPAALGVALRDGGPPSPRPEIAGEVRDAIRTRPDLQVLLQFAASEDFFRLRQRLKLAIA